MAAVTPGEQLTWYVINYFGRLMTKAEWLAHHSFIAEEKARVSMSPELFADVKPSDPDVL